MAHDFKILFAAQKTVRDIAEDGMVICDDDANLSLDGRSLSGWFREMYEALKRNGVPYRGVS